MGRVKSYKVEVLPSGNIVHGPVVGGDPRPARPLWVECDFCCQKADRVWIYPTYAFGVHVPGCKYDSHEGAWAACVYCHPLFELQEWPVLAARGYLLIGNLQPGTLEPLHAAVYSARKGPVHTWEAGQPEPVYTR